MREYKNHVCSCMWLPADIFKDTPEVIKELHSAWMYTAAQQQQRMIDAPLDFPPQPQLLHHLRKEGGVLLVVAARAILLQGHTQLMSSASENVPSAC